MEDDGTDLLSSLAKEIDADLDALEAPDAWGIRLIFEESTSGHRIARLYPRLFTSEEATDAFLSGLAPMMASGMVLNHFAMLKRTNAWSFPDGNWMGIYSKAVRLAVVPF